MFRCITDLKALAIDLDSFSTIDISRWNGLYKHFKCLFILSEESEKLKIKEVYPDAIVYHMEKFIKLFAPSPITHAQVLEQLGVDATEMAYLSTDFDFLNKAMSFLGGTIWITDSVNYEEASKSPDLICRNFGALERLLTSHVKGFLGEIAVYPEPATQGMVIPVEFEAHQDTVPLYMMGRYFGYSHYMNQLHPYSTAIALNKKEGRPYYKKFDEVFARLYICAVQSIQNQASIDGIVSVPPRPERPNRFEQIVKQICKKCNINDLTSYFQCIKDYPPQKNRPSLERQQNVKGVFSYKEDLSEKNIIIIDDIVTTGSTMRECIKELRSHGASKIFVIVLAINQLGGIYWSTDPAQVSCPDCGDQMKLLINSHTNGFFYSCYNCRRKLGFEKGRTILCNRINSEWSTP